MIGFAASMAENARAARGYAEIPAFPGISTRDTGNIGRGRLDLEGPVSEPPPGEWGLGAGLRSGSLRTGQFSEAGTGQLLEAAVRLADDEEGGGPVPGIDELAAGFRTEDKEGGAEGVRRHAVGGDH